MKNIRDTKVKGFMSITTHTEVNIDFSNPKLREELKRQHCDIEKMWVEDIIQFIWVNLPELIEAQDEGREEFEGICQIETID